MGILFAFIGLTNLVNPLVNLFTLPIVRDIQPRLGLFLTREGVRLAISPKAGALVFAGVLVSPWQVALGGAGVLFIFQRPRRSPSGTLEDKQPRCATESNLP